MGVAEVVAQAEVRLWGGMVGAVVELDNRRIIFEYAEAFRGRGLEISPIHLPVSRRGPVAFDELLRSPAFDGLPGVLADALPDAFGNRVIRAWFEARGESDRALSPVQRLLYVGTRALGALTFHPAVDVPVRPAEQESLDIAALVRDARRIIEGDPHVAIPEIYRIGSSAGGMRPKAVVWHNPATGLIRSANAAPAPGDVACILKFDGVSDGATVERLGTPMPYNRIEAAYGKMAVDAGLEMADISVLEDRGHAHLLIRRFDIEDGTRLHQHTFGGLVHVDYNDIGASSYEEYLRAVLRLGMAYPSLEQAWLRMAFNVLAVNQDDHVKNLSFHMDQAGAWRLAPAYDVTFAKGGRWTRTHQMRVRDKLSGITTADLLAVADAFGLKKPARLLDRIRGVLARWEEYAKEPDVPAEAVRDVRAELDQRARELAA